ncbi:PAS domain S-box protein [bacterium]|nr:PAS domain S-box protein [bacterium]
MMTVGSLAESDRARAAELLAMRQRTIYERTDRLFAGLLIFEWLLAIVFALLISPHTWIGETSSLHIHVLAAVFLGALLVSFPLWLVRNQPGHSATRNAVACAQMLMSSLLIHTSGGRIETHFHIFGSLAFLGFYRDWKVFVPATLVIVTDHWLRGTFYPLSVFGVAEQGSWRWLEHGAWIVFCDFFLIQSALQSQAEMRQIAEHEAQLESNNLAQLRAERERFRLAFENAPIGMALLSPNGRFESVNEVMSDLVGYGPDELKGMQMEQLLEAGAEIRAESREFRLSRKGGQGIWVLGSLSRCAEFSIAQIVDLSQRKQAEQALQQAQKLESVGLLAGGIAHEINTPIQYIGDNLRFLRDSFQELQPVLVAHSGAEPASLLGEEIPESIEHSLQGVARVASIVRSMKDYSQTGGREMLPANVNELIENALIISRSEWECVARVETDLQDDLPEPSCDRGEMGQVILNLLINASHANQEKYAGTGELGSISIRTRGLGPEVEIRIQDSGTGIPLHLRERIFEPFFTTKEVGRGTGQGLAVAQAAILRHKGRLQLDSEPGEGSVFSIYLPTLKAEVGP